MRCYRIASDAQETLNGLRFTYLPKLRKEARLERDRLERFLRVIRRPGVDPVAAEELEDFVRDRLDVERRAGELEALHARLEAELGELFNRLLDYNDDFEALQKLEDRNGGFSAAELAELRPLLGLYGAEVERRLQPGSANAEYAGQRQMYWGRRRAEAPHGTVEHKVAERAYTRYGLLLDELLADPDG